MSATALLSKARELKVELWAVDEDVRFRAPAGNLTAEFRAELRAHKTQLLPILRAQPLAVDEAEAHYRNLCAYLKQTVETPSGPGELWQVFRQRATVIINDSLSFFHPSQVQPAKEKKDVTGK